MALKYIMRLARGGKADFQMREVVGGATLVFMMRVAAVGLAFLFTVALTRILGPEGAGQYFLVYAAASVATVFGRVGLDNVLLRFAAANSSANDLAAVKGVYEKGMTIAFFASLSSAAALFFLAPVIAGGVFGKPELAAPLRWASFAVVPVSLLFLYAELLKGLRRVVEFSFLQGQQGVGISALSIAGLYIFARQWGVVGAVWGYVAAAFLCLLAGFFMWRRATPGMAGVKGNFPASTLLKSGVPLLWVAAMNLVVTWTSTFILGAWASNSDVGIFNVAMRASMLATVILLAFNSIIAPRFASLHAEANHKELGRIARDSAKLMAFAAAPILAVFLIFPGWVIGLFGQGMSGGTTPLVILSIGQFVNIITGPVSLLLMMCGHEVVLRNNITVIAALNIVLNLLLIPSYGINGAAVATAASTVAVNLVSVYLVLKYLDIWPIPFVGRSIGRH